MTLRRPILAFAIVAFASLGGGLAACGGSSVPAGTVNNPITVGTSTVPVEPTAGSGAAATAPAATDTAGATTAAAAAAGDAAAGKGIFSSAGCVACHTLKDAGSNGQVGPNLDSSKPAAALVVDRVTNGRGIMPSFKDKLSAADIQNVAAYVASVAGK